MNLAARCRQAVRDLNQAEGWGLPREALETLCERVSRFVSPDISPAELTRTILNYYQDGPRYEAMLQPDSIEGERDWEAIRRSFARLAASYGVTPTAVEDAVQEAWYKATKGLGSFAFRSRLSVWLRSIIAHTCRDWYRRNRASMDVASLDGLEQAGGPLPDPSAENPEEFVLERERLLWLEAGLRRLLSQRDLQILRYTYGQPAGDGGDGPPGEWNDQRIAEEVGLAPSSVASVRRRILKRLRDHPDLRELIGDLFGPDWIDRGLQVS